MLTAGLAACSSEGRVAITAAGHAWIARHDATLRAEHLDPFIAQHISVSTRNIAAPERRRSVIIDDTESPLGWLARRKGRDGLPCWHPISWPRANGCAPEFTRAQMMPRVTANWQAAVSHGARAENSGRDNISETIISARQRVRLALDAVGPEFSGLLVDVCCFLKGLEDVERERAWPTRSAKIVLQLALDRLARHYGLEAAARGKSTGKVRTWSAASAGES